MKHKLFTGVLCVVLASVCYGITPILSNTALNGGLPAEFVTHVFGENAVPVMAADGLRAMTNESVVGISMGIACLLSLVNCAVRRKRVRVSGRQAWQLALLGGGALLATLLLITYSYLRIPAGLTIVLNFTYPVFVVIAMTLFFKERLKPMTLLTLAAAIVGIVLISHASIGGSIDMVGVVIAIVSGIAYAVYFLAGRNSAYAGLDTSVSNLYITGSACVFGMIIAIAFNRFSTPSDWFMWLILFLEALLGYTIGLQLLLKGIRLLGSTTASALNTLEPAFASITSMIVFGEPMWLTKGIGVVLVLAAAAVSIITLRKPGKPEALPR